MCAKFAKIRRGEREPTQTSTCKLTPAAVEGRVRRPQTRTRQIPPSSTVERLIDRLQTHSIQPLVPFGLTSTQSVQLFVSLGFVITSSPGTFSNRQWSAQSLEFWDVYTLVGPEYYVIGTPRCRQGGIQSNSRNTLKMKKNEKKHFCRGGREGR